MSGENVDALRSAVKAFNEGDLDGVLAMYDPQAVFVTDGSAVDRPAVMLGADQIRATLQTFIAEFADFRMEVDELLDAGDKLICVQRWAGTGRGSGIPIELAEIIVFTFKDGKIIEGRVHPDRTSALQAAGLSE
jgi:ketosteroid isomerase-like protein